MQTTADLIITNARVLTMDAARPRADAIAIAGNRILAVGAEADILASSGPATRDARLACVHGAYTCMQVVDTLHNLAGTTAMRMHSPLERKLRDAHGCASHRWVSHPLYQDLGAVLLGNEPSEEFKGAVIP